MSEQDARKRLYIDAMMQSSMLVGIMVAEAGDNLMQHQNRIPMYGYNEAAEAYIEELLNADNPARIKSVIRLSKQQFLSLERWCYAHSSLEASPSMSIRVKVAIYLNKVATACSAREAAERWKKSPSQISKAWHEVNNALLKLHRQYVIMPPVDAPTSIKIQHNPKWWPFFDDCIGAIDGTLIEANIGGDDRNISGTEAWRCRKGFLCQNVLAAVDFDMNFIFINAGYEGSAHDAAVYRDALLKGLLKVPPGKYFVADAGYTERDGFNNTVLSPYQKVRYHLKEWRHASNKPQNAEELFNLRHATLRNVVERVFGVLKWRFQILQSKMHGYSIESQIKMVYVLTGLHNFLNKTGSDPESDWRLIHSQNEVVRDRQDEANSTPFFECKNQVERRKEIADYMWSEYELYLSLQDEFEAVE